MKKVLTLILFGMIIVITLELGYLTFSNKKSSVLTNSGQKPLPKETLITKVPTPTPFLLDSKNGFKIIYQKDGDVEGRTIIYQSSSTELLNANGLTNKAVGSFLRWEPISQSADKYLYLYSYEKRKAMKFRVWFEPSQILTKRKVTTLFAVEEINKTKTVSDWQESTTLLGGIEKQATLSATIQPDDAVVVIPLTSKGKDWIKEENSDGIAAYLIVRRNKNNWVGFPIK